MPERALPSQSESRFGRNVDRAVADLDSLPHAHQRAVKEHRTEYRILVCGSRDFGDRKVIRAFMRELTVRERFHPGERIIVVHGAARGVDRWAGEDAKACGFDVEEHPADWKLYGKRAGLIRNAHMLSLGCTRVVAFWDGKSRGTQHMMRIAREAGARVTVVREGDADIEAHVNAA